MSEKPTVLLVEDDPAVQNLVRLLLVQQGLNVRLSGKLDEARALMFEAPAMVVLDLALPDGNGLDFCREIKVNPASSETPVFILTALGSADDIVNGLEAGADDYLCKPFNEREFQARVAAILRRMPAEKEQVLVSGTLKIDLASHDVWVGKRKVKLTLREFEILQALMQNPGKALTRQDVINLAWGQDVATVPRAVDVHVGHLRAKLGPAAKQIETVPQVGYKLNPVD